MKTTGRAAVRRGLLSRLLIATAIAPMVGVTLSETVSADKKDKKKQETEKRIKKRINQLVDSCESNRFGGGGKATVKPDAGKSMTVECNGSQAGDYTCTVHSKGMRCFATRPAPTTVTPVEGGSTPSTGGDHVWQGDVHDGQPTAEPDPNGESDPVLT